MPWDTAFKRNLNTLERQPVWIVESLGTSASDAWSYGKDWAGSTHYVTNYVHTIIVPGSVRVQGPKLNTQTWTSTIGGFTFDVRAEGMRETINALRRGYVIVLKLGFGDQPAGDFQRVLFGRLQSMTRRGAVLTCRVGDPLDMLVTRMGSTQTSTQFFGGVGASTVVSSGFSFTANVSTTLEVDSTSGFQRETGGTGAIRCTPSGGTAFYLKWSNTGTTPTRFVVNTNNAYGTTQADLAAGDTVEEIALLSGNPFDIFRRVWCSTGDGTNGTWDDYPKTWGVGMPESYVGVKDAGIWKDRYTSDSALNVGILVSEQQNDGLSWFRSIMGKMGIFPVMRQGSVSARSALDASDPGVWGEYHQTTITDDDIESILRHDYWDPQKTFQCARYRTIHDPDASPVEDGRQTLSASTITEQPGRDLVENDVSTFVWANGEDTADAINARVGRWARMVPEVVELRTSRWKGAQLCIGDVVLLTTDKTLSREGSGAGFADAVAIVTGIDYFDRAGSRVVLAIPPSDGG